MSNGWIKLHRKITESPAFADPDIFRLWVWCLMKATHKDTRVVIDKQVIDLQPGQFVTGRSSLSEQYNSLLSKRKKIKDTTLWNWMKKLQDWGNIDIKSTNKYSIITIVKWIEYQETLTTDCQQIDSNLTAACQQIDTNKNLKNLKNYKELNNDDNAQDPFKKVIQAYEENGFGMLSNIIVDKLQDLINEFSEQWVLMAFERAVEYNRRNLAYVKSILDNWKNNGGPDGGVKRGVNRKDSKPSVYDDDDAIFFGIRT